MNRPGIRPWQNESVNFIENNKAFETVLAGGMPFLWQSIGSGNLWGMQKENGQAESARAEVHEVRETGQRRGAGILP